MKPILFLLLFSAIAGKASAQTTYRTVEGHIVVTGDYKGEKIIAQSHNLKFFLNYTTKEFTGRIDLRTLKTGNRFLDSLMLTVKDSLPVSFSGTIPDDDFITWKHPVLKLNVPVMVNANEIQKQLLLAATLEHFEASGAFVCSLSGFVDLSLSQFNYNFPDFKDTVKAQFVQLLLKR